MIRNNKLSSFIERIEGNRRPITADIFLTNYCNLACSYCRYAHESGEYMHFKKFKEYVQRLQALGVKSFILTGGGEPTINPDFNKITAYLEENDLHYGINTNMVVPIVCSPVFVKVSVDSGISENFAALRGKNKLPQVMINIKDYLRKKPKQTKVGVQCVASSEENVVSFVKAFSDIPVDYIYIRPIESRSVGKITATHVLSWLAANGIKDDRINLSYKFNLMAKHFKRCSANWSAITIDHNGNVMYCCHKPLEIVGHIMDGDVLNKRMAYNTNMQTCEIPCRLSGANEFVDTPMEKDRYFI